MAPIKLSLVKKEKLIELLREKNCNPNLWNSLKIDDPIVIDSALLCFGDKRHYSRLYVQRVSSLKKKNVMLYY